MARQTVFSYVSGTTNNQKSLDADSFPKLQEKRPVWLTLDSLVKVLCDLKQKNPSEPAQTSVLQSCDIMLSVVSAAVFVIIRYVTIENKSPVECLSAW